MPRNKLSAFDKELRTAISQNLKKYAGHLTQGQLSDMTGIPVSTLSGYFAMRSTPNPGNVQRIADALNIQKSDIDPRFSDSFMQGNDHPNDLNLSPYEKSMVKKYRCLTPDGKATVDAVIEVQYNAVKPKSEDKKGIV